MSKRSKLPVYIDGIFHLYRINDTDDLYPNQVLVDVCMDICFQELSVFDKLKYELSSVSAEITKKIRIPQMKEITSDCVLKIDDEYHRVYNAAHFTNKDGYRQSDITLEKWTGSTEAKNETKK